MASGNAAVMAERSKKKEETMTVKLGNLLPHSTATLKIQIVHQLEVVGGCYALTLPLAFYPDYRKHGVRASDDFVYQFAYEVCIVSETKICNLSIPDQAEVAEKDDENQRIVVRID